MQYIRLSDYHYLSDLREKNAMNTNLNEAFNNYVVYVAFTCLHKLCTNSSSSLFLATLEPGSSKGLGQQNFFLKVQCYLTCETLYCTYINP